MRNFDLINDTPTTNKTVFLRCDLDVPLDDSGFILDDSKIVLAMKTINYLVKTGARVVIATHLGNPKGQRNEKLSTKVIAEYLHKHLRCNVKFCNDCVGEPVKKEIFRVSYGDVVVLENLRFHSEEENCDLTFARSLADGMNIYVNDAFSCCHLKHASILGVPFFIRATAGLLLDEEVSNISKILDGNNNQYNMAIIGGGRLINKFDILSNLVDKVQYLVLVGEIANTFLYTSGKGIGKSLHEIEFVERCRELMREAEKNGCNIVLPVDVVITNEPLENAKPIKKLATDIKDNDMVVDVSRKTLSNIKYMLSIVDNVIVNGTAGIYEIPKFAIGSELICRLVAKATKNRNIHSIAGGSDTLTVIDSLGEAENFSRVYRSNASFHELLSGHVLSGLEVLYRLSKIGTAI